MPWSLDSAASRGQPGGMPPEYLEREPPAVLAGVVRRLWSLRMPSPQRFEQIVPMPFAHLIVNLSDPYRMVRRGRDAVGEELRGAFLSGIQSDYLVNENPAVIHHVGAELQPWALPALGISAPVVAGRVVPAAAVLDGIDAVRTVDDLESLLLARLEDGMPADPRAVAAASQLLERPDTPIGALVAASGVGHTRLLDLFRAACGVTPKRFAELCRHHRFLQSIPDAGELPSWTELLQTASFYDQPHFIREFRRFTGMTPTAYLENRRRFGVADPSFLALDSA
jgi:AraC-like DNA-binding protein